MNEPQQGWMYRRRADGRRYRVVYVSQRSVPPMVQLRPAEATNRKNTNWVQLENFDHLYERLG